MPDYKREAETEFAGKIVAEICQTLDEMCSEITDLVKEIKLNKDEEVAKKLVEIFVLRNQEPTYSGKLIAECEPGDTLFEELEEDTKTHWVDQYEQLSQHKAELEALKG
ncbi:hypothetical protein LQW54_004270 [Pestalotiopsis sp. IQ-011]